MREKTEKIWDKYDDSIKLSDKKQKIVIKECLAELDALSEVERNADYYYLKGHIHYIYEIPDSYNGKDFFQKAVEINPSHNRARMYLGHCFYDEGNYTEAENNFLMVDKSVFNDFYQMKIEEILVCNRVRISNLDEVSLSQAKEHINKYAESDYLDDYPINLNSALKDFGLEVDDLVEK